MADSAELPAVTFSNLVISLASSAMVNLGETADPTSGATQVDLPMARHSIDALAILETKTAGNLDDEEAKLLSSLLHELRAKFVETSQSRSGPDA